MRLAFTLCVLLHAVTALAEAPDQTGAVDPKRVLFDYQMHCQGCHTPDGVGAMAVPRLQGHIGNFLASETGREYLVRVPGAATSALDDARLAAVLNWMLLEFGGDSLPENYDRYSAGEVARLRQHPLNEVDAYRVALLAELARSDTGE